MFKPAGYRKIPCKIVVNGDVELGKTYIGQAKQCLLQLERKMSFQKLSQLYDAFEPVKGIIIECWMGFGLSQITITAGRKVEKAKEKLCPKCMCGCHVSLGVIAFTEPIECRDHILDLQFVYDVVVCQKKTKYIELTECQPTDFTRFADGDLVYVLWVPVPPETYAGNLRAGCIMEASSWGRILSVKPTNNQFDKVPC